MHAVPDLTLTGRFEPAEELTYRHLPFTVPPGIEQLQVRVAYNARIGSSPALRGGNTLDIGLFDERGSATGSAGFRGWSGSEKTEITIGRDWATPPYRAGAPGPGTWSLLLGAYKVAPEGLIYEVEIWFDPGIEAAPFDESPGTLATGPVSKTPALEPGWARGDLHCHSTHSDGDSSPGELLAAAEALGFDFLGITDHNAPPFAGHSATRGLLLIPGTEVTTYGGHWNVWGGNRWYDFREPVTAAMAREMTIARQTAGLVSINHPRPLGPEWTYGTELDFQAVEVWNGPWFFFNTISLEFWDELLQQGRRVVAIGGSDTHKLKNTDAGILPTAQLGQPTVWVKPAGPLTVDSVLEALRQGHSFISASPSGPQLIFEPAEAGSLRIHAGGARGDTLMLIAGEHVVESHTIERDDWSFVTSFPPAEPYVRAQIVDEDLNMRAIANPIWRDQLGV